MFRLGPNLVIPFWVCMSTHSPPVVRASLEHSHCYQLAHLSQCQKEQHPVSLKERHTNTHWHVCFHFVYMVQMWTQLPKGPNKFLLKLSPVWPQLKCGLITIGVFNISPHGGKSRCNYMNPLWQLQCWIQFWCKFLDYRFQRNPHTSTFIWILQILNKRWNTKDTELWSPNCLWQ